MVARLLWKFFILLILIMSAVSSSIDPLESHTPEEARNDPFQHVDEEYEQREEKCDNKMRDYTHDSHNKFPIVRFVGGVGNEPTSISQAVELAFDVYRKNLVTLVEGIDNILEKMDRLNAKNNFKFALVHSKMKDFALQLPEFWEHNEQVLRQVIQPWDLKFAYLILPSVEPFVNESNHPIDISSVVLKGDNLSESHPKKKSVSDETEQDIKKDIASYNSIVQLLVHLNRDWSSFGATVRKNLYYDGILPLLQKLIPFTGSEDEKILGDSNRRPRVLVPGAGLGRLLAEIAAIGYDVEGNECSGTMVATMNTLFNHLLFQRRELGIYPFLHNPLQDDWNLESRSIKALFPFVDDSSLLQNLLQTNQDAVNKDKVDMGPITIQYGDFVGIYGNQHKERREIYDAVITCFFIDTSQDVIEYIDTIFHILRPGGIWINLGPLHYHSRQAVPYSFNHLLDIIELSGFQILEDTKVVEAAYCGEDFYSMKPEVYRVPLTAFRKVGYSCSSTSEEGHVDVNYGEIIEDGSHNLLGSTDEFVAPAFHQMNYKIVK